MSIRRLLNNDNVYYTPEEMRRVMAEAIVNERERCMNIVAHGSSCRLVQLLQMMNGVEVQPVPVPYIEDRRSPIEAKSTEIVTRRYRKA
jgi:hypothetical protein